MKTFLELTIGGVPKGELLARLHEAGIQFNEYAKILFEDPAFSPDAPAERVELVRVKPIALGLTNPYSLETVLARAAKHGLSPCPLHLGPFLRLAHLNQPAGPYLTVASARPKNDETYPAGFYVRNFENSLWLRGYRASGDCNHPPENEFVFLK